MDKNEIIERLGEIAKHAVHTIDEEPFIMSLDDGIAVYEAIEIIQQSQPQPPYNPDEWCHDCKEYDQERHCCPRWNRVIRKTVDELRAE